MSTPTPAAVQARFLRSMSEHLERHPELHPVTVSWTEVPGYRTVSLQLQHDAGMAELDAWAASFGGMWAPSRIVDTGHTDYPADPRDDTEAWTQHWFRIDGEWISTGSGVIVIWVAV